MVACSSCLKSVCHCDKIDDEPVESPSLIEQPCAFARGIHDNVTVEIGYDCKVISMKKVNPEQVFLCDPCESEVPSGGEELNEYERGYQQAKEIFEDIGYNKGYIEGKESGSRAGESEGYAKGFAEGREQGFDEGRATGEQSVDCDEKYTEGYNDGLREGTESKPDDIKDIIEGIAGKTPKRLVYTAVGGSVVTAIISADDDGKWSADDDSVTVDAETGKVTVDASKVDPESEIVFEPFEEE